jgi:hypothetical protein
MNKLHSIFAVLILCAGICAQAAEPASDSRYNPSTARKLSPEEAKNFGPKSGNIRYDSRMIRAAEIAAQRARAHSTMLCWRYVKYALLDAKAVTSYPDSLYAKQAATQLCNQYGFQKLAIRDPHKAPIGAVLVYGGPGAGHVEIRAKNGYVSDFRSPTPSNRPFLGAFVLPNKGS